MVGFDMLLHYIAAYGVSAILVLMYIIVHWSLYFLSWFFYDRGCEKASVVAWALLHLAVHIGNIYLYIVRNQHFLTEM